MNFYDKNGDARCYTDDYCHLYTFSGNPIGYMENGVVWHYNGSIIGRIHNNWILDNNGNYALFSEVAVGGPLKPLRKLAPLKCLKRLRPLKRIKNIPPLTPLVRNIWSSIPFEELFRLDG